MEIVNKTAFWTKVDVRFNPSNGSLMYWLYIRKLFIGIEQLFEIYIQTKDGVTPRLTQLVIKKYAYTAL